MKAIKDCKWKVRIDDHPMCSSEEYYWIASTKDLSGVDAKVILMDKFYQKESTVRKHWERFARINKIKNWEYVN